MILQLWQGVPFTFLDNHLLNIFFSLKLFLKNVYLFILKVMGEGKMCYVLALSLDGHNSQWWARLKPRASSKFLLWVVGDKILAPSSTALFPRLLRGNWSFQATLPRPQGET